MASRQDRASAAVISAGMHLLVPLLVWWAPASPVAVPPVVDTPIAVRLIPAEQAAPPRPLEPRIAETPSEDRQASAAMPAPNADPPPAPTRDDGHQVASPRAGTGDRLQPVPQPQAVTASVAQTASQAAAPPSPDAPPAPRVTGEVEDSWEARLMARLEQFRRYPAAARARRQQGVVYVRARISREGRLLAVELDQSSGHPLLDAAALQTFRSAQPLPTVPDAMPAPQELSVPVEFFQR